MNTVGMTLLASRPVALVLVPPSFLNKITRLKKSRGSDSEASVNAMRSFCVLTEALLSLLIKERRSAHGRGGDDCGLMAYRGGEVRDSL